VFEMERDVIVNLTKARARSRARARVVAAAINHEGPLCPAFAWASQNMVAVATLLDTWPTPSTDGVDKVYCQLKDILGVTVAQQVESLLQRRAEVSLSSLGRSKASRQRMTMELPMVGTASLPT
jgi:hypothetical protein